MISDHILLIFGHFKLFPLKLPDMFYLLQLILKPFLSLLINMLDILNTFGSLGSGMIINSIWPVWSQKWWISLKMVIFRDHFSVQGISD